jgi:hypothetical protein
VPRRLALAGQTGRDQRRLRKQALLFLKKKRSKKTFGPLRACAAPAGVISKNQSFFCFFFVHKKEVLPSFLPRNGTNRITHITHRFPLLSITVP